MKRTLTAVAAATIALSGATGFAGVASAQPRPYAEMNQGHYAHHNDWRRGHRMRHEDWSRGERVDWRRHHLRHPPRGYEWREVDGNYVMAAVATGLIASIIANNH